MQDLKGVPFVATYIGYYQDEKFGYLVTKFIPGKEMFEYIKNAWSDGIPLENLRVYLVQIILALQSMHERGVIYRDIKPENILLTEKGITLVDFDMSKRNIAKLERTFSWIGTPEYFPPEILHGTTGHDSRADIYCLGLLLFEMLSGKPRFTVVKVPGQKWNRVTHPRQVWSLPSSCPQDGCDLIHNLIRTNPDERISLAQALEHPFLAGIDIEKVRLGTIVPPLRLPTL
jgi:serine/threonine protein kinase